MPFVPDDFRVLVLLETGRFRLTMLTVHDVVKDYDAMMSRVVPDPTLTLEQNLIDLGWHQYEFQQRRSFTYTVVSLDETRVLGCVYIYPPWNGETNFDARILMWVRTSEWETGMDPVLGRTVIDWIRTVWPFRQPIFPSRDLTTGALLSD
jgi:hypothetical protein